MGLVNHARFAGVGRVGEPAACAVAAFGRGVGAGVCGVQGAGSDSHRANRAGWPHVVALLWLRGGLAGHGCSGVDCSDRAGCRWLAARTFRQRVVAGRWRINVVALALAGGGGVGVATSVVCLGRWRWG